VSAPRAVAPPADGLVSVIVPTYNYGHFVERAIASVEAQDYPAIEIIVIDDGSTDDTAARLAARAGILYVRQDNQGLSAARNHGLRLAHGEFLQFLDADDLLSTDAIRHRVAFLRAHPKASAVFCRSVLFTDERELEAPGKVLPEWTQPAAGEVDLALYFANVAPPHAFLVRRAVVAAQGLTFDPGLRACEDYDFWYRLARASGPPVPLADTHVCYRQHADSMSRSHANQYRMTPSCAGASAPTSTAVVRGSAGASPPTTLPRSTAPRCSPAGACGTSTVWNWPDSCPTTCCR
jgi:GT2 family glycosyltransferase